MLTIEPRIVNVFWACSPISVQSYVLLLHVLRPTPNTLHSKHWCPIMAYVGFMHIYLSIPSVSMKQRSLGESIHWLSQCVLMFGVTQCYSYSTRKLCFTKQSHSCFMIAIQPIESSLQKKLNSWVSVNTLRISLVIGINWCVEKYNYSWFVWNSIATLVHATFLPLSFYSNKSIHTSLGVPS